VLQKAASLRDGGRWALFYIPFEKSLGCLICLAGPAGALSRLKGASFSSGSRVALDRGETHIEKACCLSLRHTSLYGGYYLLAEVF
jgi:hypothetical protein